MRSQFSQTQLEQPALNRKCTQCMTSAPEPPDTPDGNIICSQCQEEKVRSQCSRTQMEQSSSTRKCKQCLTHAQKASPAKTTSVCYKCGERKERHHFSVWGWSRQESCCLDCSKPTFHWCSQCQQDKLKHYFSHTQLQRPWSQRKCKQCIQQGATPPINKNKSS